MNGNRALDEVIGRIDAAFRAFADIGASSELTPLLPTDLTSGKIYEAFVLTKVAEKLVLEEGLSLSLVNSNEIALKSAPGPINRDYPRIDVYGSGQKVAELWTDIEFLSFSCYRQQRETHPVFGDYHELDILMVDAGIAGRPAFHQIWLGVECKNTVYSKAMLREVLGIRRELGLFYPMLLPTRFARWPRDWVPACPPSCLLVFSSDHRVTQYSDPGTTFGVEFIWEEMY